MGGQRGRKLCVLAVCYPHAAERLSQGWRPGLPGYDALCSASLQSCWSSCAEDEAFSSLRDLAHGEAP